jgi:S-(hydroxymethyl)glutathione dehydrogenase/alcohol dehydrogenase
MKSTSHCDRGRQRANPGPREVLIRTWWWPGSVTDLHFMEGLYPHPLPAVLGA